MKNTKKQITKTVKALLMIVLLASLIICASCGDDKNENSAGDETSAIKKDTNSLDNVYTAIKAAMGDEEFYWINTNGKLVALSKLRSDSGNEGYRLLADEFFGQAAFLIQLTEMNPPKYSRVTLQKDVRFILRSIIMAKSLFVLPRAAKKTT